MQGFVVNYETATSSMASQIMESYLPSQVPVISALAQNYAVSDAWYCSVPSQTLPNRMFFHAGTSNGNVDNGDPANPFEWDVPSIFNVLHSIGRELGGLQRCCLDAVPNTYLLPQALGPIPS